MNGTLKTEENVLLLYEGHSENWKKSFTEQFSSFSAPCKNRIIDEARIMSHVEGFNHVNLNKCISNLRLQLL